MKTFLCFIKESIIHRASLNIFASNIFQNFILGNSIDFWQKCILSIFFLFSRMHKLFLCSNNRQNWIDIFERLSFKVSRNSNKWRCSFFAQMIILAKKEISGIVEYFRKEEWIQNFFSISDWNFLDRFLRTFKVSPSKSFRMRKKKFIKVFTRTINWSKNFMFS